jgi:hypothetical protein
LIECGRLKRPWAHILLVGQESSMESDKVNRWLTLGANVGVLVGIILLVVELEQNREMIQMQTRNDISQQLVNRLLTVGSNAQLASVKRRAEAGEDLNADEEQQYFLYFTATMRDWENIHYQYRHGMFDEREFAAEKSAWHMVMNNNRKYYSRFWCQTGRNYSPEFVVEIGSVFDNECPPP